MRAVFVVLAIAAIAVVVLMSLGMLSVNIADSGTPSVDFDASKMPALPKIFG